MILIVEDDLQTRTFLRLYLDSQGYPCTLAANAAEARDIMEERRFKLVISDVHMPGESGLDFLEWALAADAGTTGIVMTGKDSTFLRARARNIGAHCYMVKPFRLSHLLTQVSSALNNGKQEAAND
ncbi:MAG: response regulator [Desulfobacteraceae bacterium]|nr:response regulator [Desulfobacteraceae bacterium]